jgi:hypothetical protein
MHKNNRQYDWKIQVSLSKSVVLKTYLFQQRHISFIHFMCSKMNWTWMFGWDKHLFSTLFWVKVLINYLRGKKCRLTCVVHLCTLNVQHTQCRSNVAGRMIWQTQNYWFFGHFPSAILKTREHNVSETGSVSFLRWGGDTYAVGSFRRS